MNPLEIQVLIVEDDFAQAVALRHTLLDLGYAVVGIAGTAQEAETMFADLSPDLLLLDIQLRASTPQQLPPPDAAEPADGIALARRLLAQQAVPVIFLTAYPDPATFERARALTPFAFLIKPWQALQLRYTLELAILHFVQAHTPQLTTVSLSDGSALLPGGIFLREPGRYCKIRFSELQALEADGTYVHLHSREGRKYTLRVPLRELETWLEARGFVRVHRSWIVSFEAIERVAYGNGEIALAGGFSVPLGRTYLDAVRQRLHQ